MNRYPTIVVVAMATVTASLFGLVLIPNQQLESLKPVETIAVDGSQLIYPRELKEYFEAPGREIYRSLGCIYCHSQQVRPEGFGADLDRGWGQRRSVPLDYVLQRPPLTGTMRTGPDLANIGVRQPSSDWHYLHLYDPQITSPGSVMPPFKFLFETSKNVNKPSGVALALPEDYPGGDRWIVAKDEAKNLVAYLLALKQELTIEQLR